MEQQRPWRRAAGGGRWTLVLALALLGAACGDDDGPAPFPYDGVYTITTWTENTEGCDAEGASILEAQTDPLLVAHQSTDDFLGVKITAITVGPCATAQACANEANGGLFGGLFGDLMLFVPANRDGDVYPARASSMFGPTDGECEALVVDATLSSPADGQVRYERRTYEDVRYPAGTDEEGEPTCFDQDEAVEAAVRAATCARLEVITASDPQPVPEPEEEE